MNDLLLTAIGIYRYIVFGAIIASWVAPGSDHPLVRLLEKATEPVFSAIRKVIPPLGGFDLSPIVVLLGLSAVSRLL